MDNHVCINETGYFNLLFVISQEYNRLLKQNEKMIKYLKEIDLEKERSEQLYLS